MELPRRKTAAAPGHLFLLFDSGVSRQALYQLPFEARRYVLRGSRAWIPVEVTALVGGFRHAWHRGADELAGWSSADLRQRLTDTVDAWQRYPATARPSAEPDPPPAPDQLAKTVTAQQRILRQDTERFIEHSYVDPLKLDPEQDALRTQLLKVYLALGWHDTAIETGLSHLLDRRGDRAATYNHLGICYFMKGELSQAAHTFQLAAEARPDDADIQRNLDRALQALGRGPATEAVTLADAPAGSAKGGLAAVDLDSFYWIE